MLTSASVHMQEPFHFLYRQVFALLLGVVAALTFMVVPLSWWERSGTLLYFVGLALLVLVLVPGVGREVKGATRWIAVGPLNLQTSEFMKLFVIIYLAGYLVRRQQEVIDSWRGFFKPLLLLILACVLLMMQPDFGTTVVLLLTAFGMLFLGGAPLWQFAALLGAAGIGLVGLVVTSPYRLERITSFLNPWADPLDSGYQLAQALIAFGRGGWTGVGLGNGVQKQFYLPEAHTDFLMAVIGEELGFVGTLAVVLLFALLVWRAFRIGAAAEAAGRRFAAYSAYGIGLWLGLQAFINVGVNVGLLPTKGLTLPFMSYGSNSLMVSCAAAGLLLRVHWENHYPEGFPGGSWWARG
jgi:cell division protein FtsW